MWLTENVVADRAGVAVSGKSPAVMGAEAVTTGLGGSVTVGDTLTLEVGVVAGSSVAVAVTTEVGFRAAVEVTPGVACRVAVPDTV